MYRRFAFEGDIHTQLDCVPLTVRRKLDLAAWKISLEGWQRLPYPARLALCHLPVDTEEDLQVYRSVMEGFCAAAAVALKPLVDEAAQRRVWNDTLPPEPLRGRLAELGCALDADAWQKLDEESRYALLKLADPKRHPAKLPAALVELGLRAGPAPSFSPEVAVCTPEAPPSAHVARTP